MYVNYQGHLYAVALDVGKIGKNSNVYNAGIIKAIKALPKWSDVASTSTGNAFTNQNISNVLQNVNTLDQIYSNHLSNRDFASARRMVWEEAYKKRYGAKYGASKAEAPHLQDVNIDSRIKNQGSFNLFEIANSIGLFSPSYFDIKDQSQLDQQTKVALKTINKVIQKIQGKKIRTGADIPGVIMYRAVPKHVKDTKFRNMDWITPSIEYAREYGQKELDGEYRIIEDTVRADYLWWDGKDVRKWGVDDGKTYAYKNVANNKKLLNAVTFDDNGNPIPLSQRFDENNSDVRYSITPEENIQQAMNGFDEMEIGTEFKTRKTPSTVAEAKTTPSDFAERINKEIQEGKFQYSVIKDRNTRQKVDSRLENEYIEDLFMEFERDVEEGRLSKETMVLGERLIQGFIKLGESDKAERAVILLAEAGTRAGQSVQAISMMKKLSPVGKLMAVKRAVQKMNEEFVPPGEEEVGLTEDEVEDIVDSDTPERADEAGERVIEAVYERLPVSMMDRLNAWRYLAMLGNPRTHVRNILGNFTFYLPRGLKNAYAMGLEKTFKVDNPTKAIVTHKDKVFLDLAQRDFAERSKEIKGEARWTDVRHIQDRQIFGGNPFFNTLEALRNFNFNLLEAEDEFFLKRVYAKSFASVLIY